MELENKDFEEHPKFRHNLWTNYEDNPDVTFLTVSHGTFEVPTTDANEFLKIRSFCTGYNTVDDIAKKSGSPINKVRSVITSLSQIDTLHLPFKPLNSLSKNEIATTLQAATEIWSEQLADTHISREIFLGKSTKPIIIGWLLETYHYIKFFPDTLKTAVEHSSGALQKLLMHYEKQERGHELFILKTLLKAGLTKQEVEESIPLVSTRAIELLLKELFSLEPASVLLVASIIEAEDLDKDSAVEVAKMLNKKYNFPIDMLDPFFEHVEIDSRFEHQKLLQKNIDMLETIDRNNLHTLVNKIHDLKHAFDLQKLEIKNYYGETSNYVPRQRVDFFAI